jgi:two-component system NarL family sensor kinase
VRGRPGGDRVGVRRELIGAYAIPALVLLVVSAAAIAASWQVARGQALKESERNARRLADLVVAPLLGPALRGDGARGEELHQAIRDRKNDGYLTEVTVWDRDGTIIFADNPSQIGQRKPAPVEVLDAIERGVTTSNFEDEPEATAPGFEAKPDGYVEVYVPFRLADRPTLAFEAYYDYSRVADTARALARNLILLVLVPLVALQLIQIPIAVSLAKRVRRHETERARLLQSAVTISERERSQIAGDLHDGPIQDIAGVGYALGAIEPAVSEDRRPMMQEVQKTVQHAVESLRRLMVDLYPPDLDTLRLPQTLVGLTVPLREHGLDVRTEIGELPELDNDLVTTLYQVARESLTNVAKHAQASTATLALTAVSGEASRTSGSVQLTIADDGVGVDPSSLDRRGEGHLGLTLLRDRVESLGGDLRITPGAAGGTTLTATIPVEH